MSGQAADGLKVRSLYIWTPKMTSKIVKKTLEEAQGVPNAEIDFSDKSLVHMDDMTRLWWVSSTLFSILVYLHFNLRSLIVCKYLTLFQTRTVTQTVAQT